MFKKNVLIKKTEAAKNAATNFENELDDLFDVTHANAMETTRLPADKDFLVMQRVKGRPGCMLGIDTVLAAEEKRKLMRMEQDQQRNIQHAEMSQQNSS